MDQESELVWTPPDQEAALALETITAIRRIMKYFIESMPYTQGSQSISNVTPVPSEFAFW
jgi:hypothetical protein